MLRAAAMAPLPTDLKSPHGIRFASPAEDSTILSPFLPKLAIIVFPHPPRPWRFQQIDCLGSGRFQFCTHRNVIPSHRKGSTHFFAPVKIQLRPLEYSLSILISNMKSTGEFDSGNSCLLVRRMAHRLSVCFTASYHTRCPHLPFFQLPFCID